MTSPATAGSGRQLQTDVGNGGGDGVRIPDLDQPGVTQQVGIPERWYRRLLITRSYRAVDGQHLHGLPGCLLVTTIAPSGGRKIRPQEEGLARKIDDGRVGVKHVGPQNQVDLR